MTHNREIFVSGFGPFKGHLEVNASYEAVKLLPDVIEIQGINFKINKTEVQVVYENVDSYVKDVWSKNPLLVVHCGVHGTIDKINIEKCSFSKGYCSQDFQNKCLAESDLQGCLRNNKCSQLKTKFHVDKFVEELNSEHKDIYQASCDTGRYLCGYIYLRSLDEDNSRVLFIHVPTIEKMESSETSTAILKIIEKCVLQLFDQKQI